MLLLLLFGFGLSPDEKPVSVADALRLMFAFGMFVLALLAYIERKK